MLVSNMEAAPASKTCLINEECDPDLYHAAYNIFSTDRGVTT
ncbi:hypothetical protein NC652_028186 [Populus alba x Populus x berolinensis]|nr:hypothetical protein NC652_028186 [Populus alba x Populus x berolinensis]